MRLRHRHVRVLQPELSPAAGHIPRHRHLRRRRAVLGEAAQVTAIGAFQRATIGWFDPAAKQYRRNPVDEQCELLSLIGDVAMGEDGPALHVHAALGLSDGTTRGGHLLEGQVYPTLEAVVTETPAELRKVMRPDLGLALIDLDQSQA
jgi:uncharacterized protein